MSFSVGDQAPDFTLKDHEGNVVALNSFRGKQPVVLVFYPGDETPGCVVQLCAIRDDWDQFQAYHIAAYGINDADAESHTKFWRHHGLKTPLLVDEGKKVSRMYGAVKKFFGHEIIHRTVIVIDRNGVIQYFKHGMPSNTEILNIAKFL